MDRSVGHRLRVPFLVGRRYSYPGNGARRTSGSSDRSGCASGGGGGASGGSGLCSCKLGKMLRAAWWWLCLGLGGLLVGRAKAPSPEEPLEQSRPYAVLRGQNLGERPRADSGGVGPALPPLGAPGAWPARGGRRACVRVRGAGATSPKAWEEGLSFAARRQACNTPGSRYVLLARKVASPGTWVSIGWSPSGGLHLWSPSGSLLPGRGPRVGSRRVPVFTPLPVLSQWGL